MTFSGPTIHSTAIDWAPVPTWPTHQTYVISAHRACGQEDGVYTFSDMHIPFEPSHHTPGFNHSSFTDSQVFISSPDPFLSPLPYLPRTAEYLSLDVCRCLPLERPHAELIRFLSKLAPLPRFPIPIHLTHSTPKSGLGHHPLLPVPYSALPCRSPCPVTLLPTDFTDLCPPLPPTGMALSSGHHLFVGLPPYPPQSPTLPSCALGVKSDQSPLPKALWWKPNWL